MKILTLTNEKWKLISDYFTHTPASRGRPTKWCDRRIVESLLYLLHTGCQWRQLPKEYPPYQTVYRRFRKLEKDGTFSLLRDTLLGVLKEAYLECCYVDGTFVRALCGGDQVGNTKIGKGSKIMAIVDDKSQPVAAIMKSAQPHEIKLLPETIEDIPDEIEIHNLVGDKAYDSDPMDQKLKKGGIELIAPHKKNRIKTKTQDGRKLKRIKKRWVVERFFAWMKPARRLLNRFEKKATLFQAFLDLFVIMTLIKDY